MESFARRAPQPAATCFSLDGSRLQVGDILLSRNAARHSLLQSATGSGYSHAALLVDDGGG